jgi:hypothetical protein
MSGMPMNLRLRPDAEEAVRAEARRTHRSQQDVLRDAVDQYLGLGHTEGRPPSAPAGGDDLLVTGRLRPPRTPYRRVEPSEDLPPGPSTLVLLDREDRL